MALLGNLRIGARLALVLAGLLLLTAAVALAGIAGLNTLHATSTQVLSQDVALAERAAEIRIGLLQARRFEKDAFINLADAERRNGYLKKWQEAKNGLEATIDRTRQLELAAQDAAALDAMAAGLRAYVAGFEATLAQVHAGALQSTQDANTDIGRVKAHTHAMEQASDDLSKRAMARAGQAMGSVSAVRGRAAAWQVGLSLAGALLAALCCWAVTRSITRPIGEAVRLAEQVAAGELRARIDPRAAARRDETGQLLKALGRMSDSLVRLVGEVRQASDSIATGSGQIASGNADLSQRTEEQASSLQQTAAAMEQMTATVKGSVDTARQASELAGHACTAATAGGEAVGQVVATMAQISDSSKKIADIIGVIDGIAFQTNILALNAAVEAARAGEHGRGFAVVAAEVRGLAQRSAQAAREIKTLIGRSVDDVEAGSRLVGEAGRAMNGLVEQVQRVSSLIGQISSASAEQSGGIGQIGTAVSQLDHMTQQNAALVEESAAAAESLSQQAGKLSRAVAAFQV
jgi:methyl-accepting chemotaxis protein